MSEEFRFWVGVDWGSQTHQVCVLDAAGRVLFERAVEHCGEAIARIAEDLLARAGDARALAVAMETPHGALLETLGARGAVIFSLNPKQLDRFRDRHAVAGAKDDRRDAYVLADALRTDTSKFRRLQSEAPAIVQLRELERQHEDLTQEKVALGNRLRELMQRYYPQMLVLGSVYEDAWLWGLWELAPVPVQTKRVSRAKVDALLKRHRIRRLDASKVLEVLRAPALYVAPGVQEACVRHIHALLARLRLVHDQLRACLQEMEALLDALAQPSKGPQDGAPSDAAILRSLPGVGPLVSATMLAEGGHLLAAREYASLRAQCGVAPVTRQSGKSWHAGMRRACNPRLRQAVYHWARQSVRYEPRAKDHYARLRAAGHNRARALRGVSDRLLARLVAMLTARTLYDPTRWSASEEGDQARRPARAPVRP